MSAAQPSSRSAALKVEGLTKRFSGLTAVDAVSFEVAPGAIRALIGPNGAGKTTTFNMIAGALHPTSGDVLLDGHSLIGMRPDQICRAGVGRTFQIVRPFNDLTVAENVSIGALSWTGDVATARGYAIEVLDLLGLADKRHALPSSITLPDRKCLEVARALATKPKLLLLDEVMAGLRPTEIDRMVGIFRKLNAETGLTIVLIEHVMRAVMALSHHVVVLNYGKVIAEGTPQEVTRDPDVLACYLGAEELSLMLQVDGIDVFYGDAQALDAVSLTIEQGAIVAIVGANGAGKTSLIRTIAGMHQPARGHIRFKGTDIAGWPTYKVCDLGIGQVAEGRQIFPSMTVTENLEMGAMLPRARPGKTRNLDRMFQMFPRLAERRTQAAGTLSGGEQQMLAIGRCLMGAPELIMFDEPSLGLSPALVHEVLQTIRDLNREGLTCVLVEQNVAVSLKLARHAYVLENGRVTLAGSGEELLSDDRVRQAYLGL